MIPYPFKIALRNIFNNRLFSLISITGLSAGMTAFLFIMLYIRYERSYDTYNKDYENIYRLRYERSSAEGESVKFASCCPPAAIRIRELYPEAEKVARIFRYRATVIFGEKKFYEERMYFAEPQLFEIFNIKFITGNPLTGISSANCAFISESYSRKYFGENDAMGQTISVDKEMNFVITGIFRDIPDNSHLKFDILLSWPNLLTHYGPDIESSWGDTGFFTYFLLKPPASPELFEHKLKDLVESDFGEVLRSYKLTCDLKVQPLSDIHLKSNYMQEMEVNGNNDTVVFLNIIAFIILIIAWVNYINITTARALTRAAQVGLSKIAGASGRQLVLHFFIETFVINIASAAVSLGLLVLLRPLFHNLTGISHEFIFLKEGWFWIIFLILIISGVLLSGMYPVYVITSLKASEVIKGKLTHSGKGILIRKALVTFQLLMSITLITCTILIYRQNSFIRKQDKGISIEDILAVRAPRVRDNSFGTRLMTFKEELIKNKLITKFSVGTEVPGRQILWDAGGIFRVGSDQSKNYQIIGIDYDYLDLLGADIIAGRNFDRSFSTDSSSLILNEKATRWMEFSSPEEALDREVNYWDKIYKIVGVVKDYCQQSPKEAFEPHIFRFMPHGRDVRGFFMMKYMAGNEDKVLKLIENEYNRFFPDNPFDHFFLEDYYNQQYKDEKLLGRILVIFSVLSIIITCLGIFGLTAYLLVQKSKEISMRQVLGSDLWNIIMLFSKDFIIFTSVSFLLAVPLSYYWITDWLNSFEVKVAITVWNFVLPYIATLLMTVITIIIIVKRTASMNPSDNLRTE